MKFRKYIAIVLTAAAVAGPFATSLPVQASNLTQNQYQIMCNMIGAVETGGQIYGNRDYSCYIGAHKNSAAEVSCTLGWCSLYCNNGRELIRRIQSEDPKTFASIDANGLIAAKLNVDWEKTKWDPNAAEKKVLIALITTDTGKKLQDEMFSELVAGCVDAFTARYHVTSVPAEMMYTEVRLLGGPKPANRVFDKVKNKYGGTFSLDNILAALKEDQADTSNNNQVGDKIFWSRHTKIAGWIRQYVGADDSSAGTDKQAANVSQAKPEKMYRVYNKKNGEHLYTASVGEKNSLVKLGWRDEGVAWTAPQKSNTPVYRLYDKNHGAHLYTTDTKERSTLLKEGWRDEGIAWYSDDQKQVPLYRSYNTKTGHYNFTKSKGEYNSLGKLGWKNEGIAWYGMN